MTLGVRHFWLFVLALATANVLGVLLVAAVFRTAPGLRQHHPGF